MFAGISLLSWDLGGVKNKGTGGTGVRTRGAGEGKSFTRGETGVGEFPRMGALLRISFSGDSTSLSSIWMSFLILCGKGGRFEGEGLEESEKGRLFPFGVLGKADAACRR